MAAARVRRVASVPGMRVRRRIGLWVDRPLEVREWRWMRARRTRVRREVSWASALFVILRRQPVVFCGDPAVLYARGGLVARFQLGITSSRTREL